MATHPVAGQPAPKEMLVDVAANGWFAARPSGTENIYRIYAESFNDQAHLKAIVAEAQQMVNNAPGTVKVETREWQLA